MTMEAARTSETSVDIQLKKRLYIPEDSPLLPLLLKHVIEMILSVPQTYAALMSGTTSITEMLSAYCIQMYAMKYTSSFTVSGRFSSFVFYFRTISHLAAALTKAIILL